MSQRLSVQCLELHQGGHLVTTVASVSRVLGDNIANIAVLDTYHHLTRDKHHQLPPGSVTMSQVKPKLSVG